MFTLRRLSFFLMLLVACAVALLLTAAEPTSTLAQDRVTPREEKPAKEADPFEGIEEVPPICADKTFNEFLAIFKASPEFALITAFQANDTAMQEALEVRIRDALSGYPVYATFKYQSLLEKISSYNTLEFQDGEEGKRFSLGTERVELKGFERTYIKIYFESEGEYFEYRVSAAQAESLKYRSLTEVKLSHAATAPLAVLDVSKTPLSDLIQNLCTKGDLDFAMSGRDVPEISLRLREIPIINALEIAAVAAGWEFTIPNNKSLQLETELHVYNAFVLYADREWHNQITSDPEQKISDLFSAYRLALRAEAAPFKRVRTVVMTQPKDK